jgi:hypothetical protein
MKKIFFYILFITASTQLFAQDIEFNLGVDSNEVLIGDQIHVTVLLKYPSDKYSLIFPNINEAYTEPFKIIEQSKIDTIESSRYTTLKQITTIASYDSGLYQLNKLHVYGFKTDADSAIDVVSDSILIKVSDVVVNINGDIKDIVKAEKKSTLLKNILIAVGCLILIIAVYYFIKKYLQSRKKPIEEKQIDTYQYVNTQLQKIKSVTLSTNLETKNYYSTLSELLKYYVQHRYQLLVLDKTSDETITAIQQESKTKDIVADAQRVLQIADMVKFAKVLPTDMQNKNSWEQTNAIVQNLEQNYQTEMQRIADAQKKNG